MTLTNLEREDRAMMSQAKLLSVAKTEKGDSLTKVEEWFVWTHPTMTFDEIRDMLDSEDARIDAEFDELNKDGAIGIDGKLNWRFS